MLEPLRIYQGDMYDFGMRRLYVEGEKGCGFLADPGLGKTRVALDVVKTLMELKEVKRTLVVAPLRVAKTVWPEEVQKWEFDLPHNNMTQWRKNYNFPQQGVIDFTNFESIHHFTSVPGRYDLILLDESTKIKNWTAKRTKALRKIIKDVPRRMIMTGTMVAYSLADMFAQIFMLDDGAALGRNVTVFRARFMERGGWQGREWKIRPGCEQELLDAIAPMVMRLDAESNLDMPELIVQDIMCELPLAVQPHYRELKKKLLTQLESGEVFAVNAASAYIKMRQFGNGQVYDEDRNVLKVHDEKLEDLKDLVEALGDTPLLVLYQFQHDLARIQEEFPDAVQLTNDNLEETVLKWNAGEIKLMLAQNASTGHGMNLQGACNHVAFYGLNDSPEIYEQSYRRVYRQGQKEGTVIVHRLLCKNTVDTVIRERVDKKLTNQKDFLKLLKTHARSR